MFCLLISGQAYLVSWVSFISALVACWCLIIAPTSNHIKGKNTLVLMHSTGIFVNGYQLLCEAHHTVTEQHRTAILFIFYSLLWHPFPFFVFLSFWQSFSFLGISIVNVNNLKRTVDLVM